ncbi:MsnO8 family LLM class oxidoreductase [Streptomyces showdoensis]|uniref:Methylene-tetrahydromethanopterin reductase n=1 Tax=Streptomyces showdoensis TaxID=68268 RepID=A0A2P2GJR1_STREW|nr:MsnO8 family LLM class oxidoreductase [Streptomyces showdoensis]KKZ71751.1 methylene-tetrahydromethanopterin reductase [Streptomyces showdoensis]
MSTTATALEGIRFSVLDRSRTREGEDAGQALRDTVALAREAEALGYHRFWVSEHHGVPGVAGSAPTVLAAAVAGATSRIRVGTGGVMLPNHQPMVVAEQFGVLASLFPGRIDMGLGRSVGFTDGIRRALGRDKEDADRFGAQLTELLGWFTGEQTAHPQVHARPAEGLRVPPFVLATGEGAAIAAAAGLPLVIGDLRGRSRMLEAVDAYRAAFRPSVWAAEPYVVVAGTVAVAATDEEARRLLMPEAWSLAYARTRGAFPPLLPPERIEGLQAPGAPEGMTEKQRDFYLSGLQGHVHGTEERVAEELARAVEESGAREVLVTTSTYDRGALLDSYRRLARLAGLTRANVPGGLESSDAQPH